MSINWNFESSTADYASDTSFVGSILKYLIPISQRSNN